MLTMRVFMVLGRMAYVRSRISVQATATALNIAEDLAERMRESMPDGGVPHVASMPGNPPNRDTWELVNSISARIEGPGRAVVTVGASYAAELEFGGATSAARPFMRPAIEGTPKFAGKIATDTMREAFR